MKAIFLGNDSRIERVYSEKVIDKLASITQINKNFYNKDMVLNGEVDTKDTEYIFSSWGMPQFSEDEINNFFPSLKAIFYAAGSVQYFAKPFLNCGIRVFSAWAANAVPVAEYTVAQIFLANKGFFKIFNRGNKTVEYFKGKEIFSKHPGNFGTKIGIIGAGMIGKLVIKKLKNDNFEILVFDPFLPEDTAKELGVQKTGLERIFSECSIVSNHLADNNETKGMLDEKLFSLMQPYATFINTGRGAQVVESDLIKVLKEREDLTALLDVTEPEPPLPDSELYKLDNCFLTPHIAGSVGLELHRMAEFVLDEFISFTEDKECKYEVTLKMLDTMA